MSLEEAEKAGLITKEEYDKIISNIELKEKYEYLARRGELWQKQLQE